MIRYNSLTNICLWTDLALFAQVIYSTYEIKEIYSNTFNNNFSFKKTLISLLRTKIK